MHILVLNGSPRGEKSVTLQYVVYLQNKFPEHTFHIVHVAQRIKRLERDVAAFDAILAGVEGADLVLWATPVFYMLVPGQVKRSSSWWTSATRLGCLPTSSSLPATSATAICRRAGKSSSTALSSLATRRRCPASSSPG